MPAPRPHVIRRIVILAVLTVLTTTVASCTADPPERPAPSTGTAHPPVNAFPPLEGRTATGARVLTSGLAAQGQRVVSAGLYWDGVATASFGWSDDGGRTWQAGHGPAPDRAVREQADHVAVRTSAGTTTWVALGSSGAANAAWTSTDGMTWDRVLVDRAVMEPSSERVTELAATDEGFAAAGSATDDRAVDRPRVWTSADGRRWTRHELPGQGAVASLAARGRTWVAVGRTDDTWVVWRSTDAGRRWTRTTRLPRVADDGDFLRFFADVVVRDQEFMAIGSYYTDDLGNGADGYHPMIYRSGDGRTWRYDPQSAALGGVQDSFGQSLVAAGDEMAAVVEVNRTLDRDEVWHWSDGTWVSMVDPRRPSDKAVWGVESPVRTDASWVAAANRTLNNSISTAFWRAEPGSVLLRPVESPPTPRSSPVTVPTDLVRWGGAWRVTGETRDRRGLWTQAEDGSIEAPQATTLPAGASVTGLAADGTTILAYGSTTGGNSDFGTVWRSTDARTFTPTGRDTFQKVDRYAYSEISDLHKFGSTWFAVGERSSNADANVSALVATSTDGRTWRPGGAARTLTKAAGDVWYDVTDLAGDHERRRRMTDVTRTSRDFLAVGSSEENGPAQATVWHSRDGRTWRSSVIAARGFARSQVDNAASIGARTVLSGWVGRKGQTKTIPYVWSSADGGASWSGRVVGRLGDTAGELVATETRFVLEGDVDGDVSTAVVQQSSDGRTWDRLPLTGVQAGPEDDVSVSDLAADRRDVVALVRVLNRVGAGSVLVRQTVG